MAIKKVYYNGSSKIIKAICNAINDLIDGGGGGGSTVTITPALQSGTKVADYSINGTSDALYAPTQPTKTSDLTNDSGFIDGASVAIQKDVSTGTVTTTLTGAANNITFVNNKAQFEKINMQGFDVAEMSGDSASGYTLLQKLFYEVLKAHTSGSGSASTDFTIVLGNDYFFEQGGASPQGGTGIVVKGTSIRFINDNTYDAQSDTDIPNEIVFPHKAGTVALLGDMPTKLSELTDDVVSGNYLPLAGGTMTGAITINIANGLKFATCSQNTNPTYLLTMDAFASGGEVKYTTASASVVNNSIVKRNANGYIYGAYFNQSSADESGTFASSAYYMLWLNGADGSFFRKVTINTIYDLFHRAYWNNGSGAYNFGYTTGNVGSLGGQLISYNSNASGYTRMYASAFNSPSCKFLKENVRDITIEDARKVLDLRPVFFDYKEPYGEKGQQGLIAEEAYKVLPSIVDKGANWDISEDADAYNQEQIEEHFMDVSGDIPSIEYSKIVPYLIKIVQDQEQRIAALENKIASLEK